ncbi:hypothetical protein LOK49_LG04G00555 [Camellia lanceoleosa]|uniref:Uncharacterized protein n=1 Tax=Camellia lanceoleosa TaxID=1840588 RepID=A0ACC0HZS3_9ERIC|nr:hypothetical protein LOK49_LG04G00555 [Camellia lanceoleosa]
MTEGDDDARFYEWDDQLESMVCLDDDESLISFMTSPPFTDGTAVYNINNFLNNICMDSSVKCATALLEGRLGIDPKTVLDGYSLLHRAIFFGTYELVKLFLQYGARTDITWDYHVYKAYKGLLPLELALVIMRTSLYRHSSSPEQSAFNLIVTLCDPDRGVELAIAKSLAWFSKDIEELAYHYAMEGKLIELAMLLIVAREDVLVPITFHGKDGAGLNGSTTIHECLKNQFVSLINEEISFMGEVKHGKFSQFHKKRKVMRLAMLLIEVFERAGNSIEEYLELQQLDVRRKQVEKDIALRLVEAGFNLKAGDLDFSSRDWFISYDSPTKCIETRSEVKLSQSWSPRMPMLQQTNVFSPQQKEILGDGHWSSVSTSGFHSIHGSSSVAKSINKIQVSKSVPRSQYSTDLDIQVKNRTKAIEDNVLKCLSRVKFVYIAMLIKRGIRIA